MIINIVIGFVIPLILGTILYKKNSRVIIFIAPISSVVSFIINEIGYSSEFWEFTPIFKENETLSALPFDVGLFPFLACLMVYIIITKRIKPFYIICFFTMVTTLLEFVFFLIGKVIYQRGWNIFFTFLSYALAYFICYYYFILIKIDVFQKKQL
jgi:hypothetical protein